MKDYTTPMTEAAYTKEQARLHAAASRAYNRFVTWDHRIHTVLTPSELNRAFNARDNARYASVDAHNAIAHFEATASIKGR